MSADSDAKRFEMYRNTGPGMRLRLAIREGNLALAHIDAAVKRMDAKSKAAWQRRYILCCNNASRAIQDLSDQFRWPLEADADLSFIWVPKLARHWLWKARV